MRIISCSLLFLLLRQWLLIPTVFIIAQHFKAMHLVFLMLVLTVFLSELCCIGLSLLLNAWEEVRSAIFPVLHAWKHMLNLFNNISLSVRLSCCSCEMHSFLEQCVFISNDPPRTEPAMKNTPDVFEQNLSCEVTPHLLNCPSIYAIPKHINYW